MRTSAPDSGSESYPVPADQSERERIGSTDTLPAGIKRSW